jgi:bacterioferritin
MEKTALIQMLNNDMAEEHAAIIRYLVHSYLEGEDTPIGAKLLSRSREEMWHMHWLGMIIGSLGGEPVMIPAAYPFDPSSRKTIFASYVAYEEKLIPHYQAEAEQVEDPHIKRVLLREGWESAMHAEKFQKMHDKLSPAEAQGLPGQETAGLPQELAERLQTMVELKYNHMLQSLRDAWVLQKESFAAWRVMDFSFTKMKQLAHLAEEVAENGQEPRLQAGAAAPHESMGKALSAALENVRLSRERHIEIQSEPEAEKHKGLMTNLDLSIKQEAYEADEIADWLSRGDNAPGL